MICHAIVGTPPQLVSRSRSISAIAASASHLRISTSLAPANSDGDSTAWQPVAWKNGTDSNVPFCGPAGSGAGGISPRRR